MVAVSRSPNNSDMLRNVAQWNDRRLVARWLSERASLQIHTPHKCRIGTTWLALVAPHHKV